MAVAVSVMVVSGCEGTSAPGPDDAATTAFDQLFESYTEYPFSEVHQHGLSDGVIEILERSRANGFVSQSDVNEAQNHTFACFDDYGIGWEYRHELDMYGVPTREFTYWAPDGVDKRDMDHPWFVQADECQSNNSLIVTDLYNNQPRSGDEKAAFLATNGAAVIACLGVAGEPAPDSQDPEAIIAAAKEYQDSTGDSSCLELAFDAG